MSGPDLKIAEEPPASPLPTPAEAAQPPPQSGGRDWLASVAHLGVIASVAVYTTGFAIAVPHYLRRTIPVRALTHDVYLGAGVLFWSLTLLGVLVGAAVVKLGSFKKGDTQGRAGNKSTLDWLVAFAPLALSFANVFGSLRVTIYVLGMMVLTALAPHRLTRPSLASPLPVLVDSYVREIVLAITLAVMFGWFIYPHVSPAFGGGAEQPLAAGTFPNETPAAATDWWMKSSCRKYPTPSSSTTPVCRRFYRVYESADSLYLGIAEWPGLCNPKERRPPQFTDSGRRCIQRISNSLLSQFEVDEDR